MRTFPSEEALVAAYWRRLARFIERPRAGKRQSLSRLKSQGRLRVRQRYPLEGNKWNKEIERKKRYA